MSCEKFLQTGAKILDAHAKPCTPNGGYCFPAALSDVPRRARPSLSDDNCAIHFHAFVIVSQLIVGIGRAVLNSDGLELYRERAKLPLVYNNLHFVRVENAKFVYYS